MSAWLDRALDKLVDVLAWPFDLLQEKLGRGDDEEHYDPTLWL